ncbi:hypothetical protein DFQ26_003321 [Actinomortierella ambigua]|nr:hypothetical protein DFQ26_003321 [Actinomortierella ambigua]
MMKQAAKNRAVQPALSNPKAIPLDMSTVQTSAPPETTPKGPPTRIFGLQDAPCYYPTQQEFMEPLKYIESIRHEAEQAGICKIIPPDGWKPSFSLDTEIFRFKTRIQRLNSMEGETRTNLNYLEQLYKFHRQQGTPVNKIPQLDKRPIDLFRLKKEVTARGGYHKVTATKKWAEIGRTLDYTRKQCTSMSNALKTAYLRIVLPFETYLEKQGLSGAMRRDEAVSNGGIKQEKREASMESQASSSSQSNTTHSNGSGGNSSTATTTTATVTKASTKDTLHRETRKSKRIKKDPVVSYAESEPSSPSNSDRMSSEPSVKAEESNRGSTAEDVCEICHSDANLSKMLICDGCELGYHTYCLNPPLASVPKADWYCAKCLVAGEDFGFEEGDEYSLNSFQQKCNQFKKSWFEKLGYKDGVVPEDVVEREFWRLVENAYETAEVEYGADLHSTQHGSGFPSLERNPTDKYSSHPFNLTNMAVLPESLFCHIKTDISGMMVPWLYVGMCFSTFCWHNEDHYTYSINYMHWGEPKTWYGIPSSDALKFEETMKQAVPELFEQQPDLLFQLVTMLSPERLVANGVKVLAIDQRPGQFVVTFPQAYHAGFNHGFNFAEAVNFAPPDWCQFGLECAQRYKAYRKQPVFSHDELIITTATNDDSVSTAQWLQHEMADLRERELGVRESARKQYPKLRVVVEEEDRPEEEVQCVYCNCYIYLSQITCSCTSKVACHDHIDELCKCDISEKALRLRFSDDQLGEMAQRVVDIATLPNAWAIKYRQFMAETRVPSLKTLRSYLAEAERIPYQMEEAIALKKFVEQANEWIESASKLMVRKHHQGRRVLERHQGAGRKRLEDLEALMKQAQAMNFDCPEIKQLQDSINTILEYRFEVRSLLQHPSPNLKECRSLLEAGLSMGLAMEELDQLEAIVSDMSWTDKASANSGNMEDYHQICDLVADARRCGVSTTNPLLSAAIEKQKAGAAWQQDVEHVTSNPPVQSEQLLALIERGKQMPVPKALLNKLETVVAKAAEWNKSSISMMQRADRPDYRERAPAVELKRLLKQSFPYSMSLQHQDELAEDMKKVDEWFAEAYSLFRLADGTVPTGIGLKELLDDLQVNVAACTAPDRRRESQREVTVTSEQHQQSQSQLQQPHDQQQPQQHRQQDQDVAMNGDQESEQHDVSMTTQTSIDVPRLADDMNSKVSISSSSDSGVDIERDEQVYCICRSSEAGMMVECDECHEWYHGTCVRVSRREATVKTNYICPVCNLGLTIRRDNIRPKLEQAARVVQDGLALRFFTPEVLHLQEIVAKVTQFRDQAQGFLNSKSMGASDIVAVKDYLRKIEGLEIDLADLRLKLRDIVFKVSPTMSNPGVLLSTSPSAPPLDTIMTSCLCVANDGSKLFDSTEGDTMIHCDVCSDWFHLGCVGVEVGKIYKLNKFHCPICSLVRKKSFVGMLTPEREAIVKERFAHRAANKDQLDAKKRRRRSVKDPLSPISDDSQVVKPTEEKRRRVSKSRDSLDGSDMNSQSSLATMPQLPSVANTIAAVAAATTSLPSFSEAFQHVTRQPSAPSESHLHHHHHRQPVPTVYQDASGRVAVSHHRSVPGSQTGHFPTHPAPSHQPPATWSSHPYPAMSMAPGGVQQPHGHMGQPPYGGMTTSGHSVPRHSQ